MNITIVRIDDRLIHGQIVTRWIDHAQAKAIWVVDDAAATDPMQQMLLKFAVPGGIQVEILSKAAALEKIRGDVSPTKALLLIKTPAEANSFLEMGFQTDRINVGNISNTQSAPGRKKILDYIYLEEQDAQALQDILNKGVEMDVRALPQEHPRSVRELLEKYRL